jgi:quercetin dioxygenase-like cupin family protein
MPVAEVVVGCTDLDANVAFFAELGWRVERVSPADAPVEVAMSCDGCWILLRRGPSDLPVSLVVRGTDGQDGTWTAPNGSSVELRATPADLEIPDAVPAVSIVGPDEGAAGVGRAGMRYRDLLPDRWGGRFVASHITIPGGGEVPDWVHHHRIRFQLIFCAAGWVEVVYEDQGPPFRLDRGDCVLQPPGIRHRVLRSSPGLEVIEIGCPAVHDTLADHQLELPNGRGDPQRRFGGQQFVRHVAAEAPTAPWLLKGLLARDTGIDGATDGLADVRVVCVDRAGTAPGSSGGRLVHAGEFVMLVVLGGSLRCTVGGDGDDDRDPELLERGAALALPPGVELALGDWSEDAELLTVVLPAGALRAVTGTPSGQPA